MGDLNVLKTPGGMLFALAVCVLVFFLAAFLVKGTDFVEYGLIPGLQQITQIALLVSILCLPLAFFRPAKSVARWAYLLSWLVFGVTAWVLGFLVTLQAWGTIGVIIGLALAGVGVVLTGILAAAIHGDWSMLIELVVLAALAYGARRLTLRLARQLEPIEPTGKPEPIR